jgi:hypothetical protein
MMTIAVNDSDPVVVDTTKAVRKLRNALTALVVAVAVFGAIAVYSTVIGVQTRTKVEQSECAKDPTNPTRECIATLKDLRRNEPLVIQCIIFERVTGREPSNCRNLDTGVSIDDPNAPPRGGGSQQTSDTSSQQDGPPSGGSSDNVPDEDGPVTAEPDNSGPPPAVTPEEDSNVIREVCDVPEQIGVTVPLVCP